MIFHTTLFDKIKRKLHPFIVKFWSLPTLVVVSKLLHWSFCRHQQAQQALALLAEAKHALPDQVTQQILGLCDKGLEQPPEDEECEPCLCVRLLAVSLWQCNLFPNQLFENRSLNGDWTDRDGEHFSEAFYCHKTQLSWTGVSLLPITINWSVYTFSGVIVNWILF